MEIKAAVAKILDRFDTSTEPFGEDDVDAALRSLKPEDDDRWEPPAEYIAERIAFSFDERSPDDDEDGQPWFMPMMSGRRDDGTHWEWPSLQDVTLEMLEYWRQRSAEAKHPVLRARYAGLVWELRQTVLGATAQVEMAQKWVDAVLEVVTTQCHEHDVEVCGKLGQVLAVAIATGDEPRVERVRDAIIGFVETAGSDDKPGIWILPFDLLYSNKRAKLKEGQRGKIIADLEGRLDRLSDPDLAGSAIDPWGSEAAAQRLAVHYRKENSTDDVRRVLLKVERAFEHLAKNADAMVAHAWLEQVERLYRRFNLSSEAGAVRRRLRKLGQAAHDSLIHHRHQLEIKKEDLEAYSNSILEGDLERAIGRFVAALVPRREQTEQQLKQLASEATLLFLVSRKILDANGRPVASLGSLEADMDGHVAAQTAQNIGIMSPWVRYTIEELIERLGVDSQFMIARIDLCPLFDQSKTEILRRGLDAYFAGDAMGALHFLVPQIEDAVRSLVEIAGGDVYRPNRQGGMDLRPLDDLLRNPVVSRIFTTDVADYLRVMYTDRRGINLRNELCHGTLASDAFAIGLADRVFHTVLMLSQVRRKEDGPDDASGQE